MEIGFIIFWFIVMMTVGMSYAVLDGFDLGVGALHLFTSSDKERRVFLNAIGPVWDGNEVWLVIFIGGLFAGFPKAYATLLSSFYLPLTFLIFSLIFRAVAIEFRSKRESALWRKSWDTFFALGSVFIALIIGTVMGNLIQGIPLSADLDYIGSWIGTFFQPYPFLVGCLTLAIFMMHGAIYLVMKTEGPLQEKIIQWVKPTTIFFAIMYLLTTCITIIYQPHMIERLLHNRFLFVIPLLNIFAIYLIFHQIFLHNYGWAFLSSCLNIICLMSLFAIGIFPELIRSSVNPKEHSVTIFNASASEGTLQILSIIVLIGLPLVFSYGIYVYRLFRGKVHIDEHSY